MNSQLAGQNTEAGILARLIQTRQDNLSRDAANYLLSIQFDDTDLARMNELSELARRGTLSAAEEAELDSYIHVGNLLAVMQSKARQALARCERIAQSASRHDSPRPGAGRRALRVLPTAGGVTSRAFPDRPHHSKATWWRERPR